VVVGKILEKESKKKYNQYTNRLKYRQKGRGKSVFDSLFF